MAKTHNLAENNENNNSKLNFIVTVSKETAKSIYQKEMRRIPPSATDC